MGRNYFIQESLMKKKMHTGVHVYKSVRICMWAPREGCVYLSSNIISSGEEGTLWPTVPRKVPGPQSGARYTKICLKMNQWTHFSIRIELLPASIQVLSQLQLSWESGRKIKELWIKHTSWFFLWRVPCWGSISSSLQIVYKVWFSSLHAPKLTSWSPSSPRVRQHMKSVDTETDLPGGFFCAHHLCTRLRNAQLWDILWKGLDSPAST